ncbi:Hypothetical predicted protein [Olea europaea subsp. europaea]|uniref:RNase H type-1 domain-containing protein n=1 Tax=Olea europaea subsp. europaea TaxID=158383 RepID=A0A8S0PZD8_OLEEU|nr:Hypothetical predicted protein [Olea europaea subsp. europaea]
MSLHVEYGLGFKQQYRPKLVQWVKPPLGCLKLNIDGCFKGSLAADGGVLRNANGDVVFAFHEFYDESCSNILEAELRALLTETARLGFGQWGLCIAFSAAPSMVTWFVRCIPPLGNFKFPMLKPKID